MPLRTSGTIDGWRPWIYTVRGYARSGVTTQQVTPQCREAAKYAFDKLLFDGQWHAKVRVTEIRLQFGVSLPGLMSALDDYGIAESDDGRWVCVENDDTPELAPGETE